MEKPPQEDDGNLKVATTSWREASSRGAATPPSRSPVRGLWPFLGVVLGGLLLYLWWTGRGDEVAVLSLATDRGEAIAQLSADDELTFIVDYELIYPWAGTLKSANPKGCAIDVVLEHEGKPTSRTRCTVADDFGVVAWSTSTGREGDGLVRQTMGGLRTSCELKTNVGGPHRLLATANLSTCVSRVEKFDLRVRRHRR